MVSTGPGGLVQSIGSKSGADLAVDPVGGMLACDERVPSRSRDTSQASAREDLIQMKVGLLTGGGDCPV